jgi:hypothetical protein
MELENYRASDRERMRTADLMRLAPASGGLALDAGAREGHFSKLLADRFEKVIALDLVAPSIADESISCVVGDLRYLAFPEQCFDFVLCAEVLEHIPASFLQKACQELMRVAKEWLLIGVPYKQDLRLYQTTCPVCHRVNPPWGHVNRFDEVSLINLFPGFTPVEISLVGQSREITNKLSEALMNFAGNPFGTYEQEEPCIFCGSRLSYSDKRNLLQRLATRTAFLLTKIQQHFTAPRGNWIHILFQRAHASS